MATSRIAHYLKCIARDKVGSFQEREDMEKWMNNWIMNYVSADRKANQICLRCVTRWLMPALSFRYSGKPGSYNAVAFLRPWLQLEELTTSLRGC